MMRAILFLLTAFLACFTLPGAARAKPVFEEITLDIGNGVYAGARYYRDDGWPAAARPVVFLLHGCSGMWSNSDPFPVKNGAADTPKVQSALQAWVTQLLAKGWGVLTIDSYTQRYAAALGLSVPVAPATLTLTQRALFKGKKECGNGGGQGISEVLDRPLDVAAARSWALANPARVDSARMALMGWSNGASTVLAALSAAAVGDGAPLPDAGLQQYKLGIAWYPGCGLDVANPPPATGTSSAYGGLSTSTWFPRNFLQVFHGSKDPLYDRANDAGFSTGSGKPQYPCTTRVTRAEPLVAATVQDSNVTWDSEADMAALLPAFVAMTVYADAVHGFDSDGALVGSYPANPQCTPPANANACAWQQSHVRALELLDAAFN